MSFRLQIFALGASIFFASCRSGHFEKSTALSDSAFQLKSSTAENLGNCPDVDSCKRVQMTVEIFGNDGLPLQNHSFQIEYSHPDILSAPQTAKTDASGVLKFPIDFKVQNESAPTEDKILLSFKSDILGTRSIAATINPRKKGNPLLKTEAITENLLPSTQLRAEGFAATPSDLKTIQAVEVTPLLVNMTVEESFSVSTQDEPKLDGRKIKYEITFSANSRLEPIHGVTQAEQGRVSVTYQIPYRPFENEKIISVKVTLNLGEGATAEKKEWTARINFDQDKLRPLVDYRTEMKETVLAETQFVDLESFSLDEIPEEPAIAVDSDLVLSFTPKILIHTKAKLSRWVIGQSSPAWRGYPLSVTGKIFAVKNWLSEKPQILSEDIFSWKPNALGEISVDDFKPIFKIPPGSEEMIWLIGVELPDLQKAEKTFFVYDRHQKTLTRWTKEDVFKKMGQPVYNLAEKSAEPENADPKDLNQILHTESLLNFSNTFDALIEKARRDKTIADWQAVFEMIGDNRKLPPKRNFNVYEILKIDRIEKFEAEKPSMTSQTFKDESGNNLEVNIRGYTLNISGNAEWCFLFSQEKPLYTYCFAETYPFEVKEQWRFLVPKSNGEPKIIRGFGKLPEKYSDVKDESHSGILIRKIWPQN